jgi:chromosome partitioning protein
VPPRHGPIQPPVAHLPMSSAPQDLDFSTPEDFRRFIGLCYQNAGYELILPPAETRGYDLELRKEGEIIAVQAANRRLPVNVAMVREFLDYLDTGEGKRFGMGWMISGSGFSPAAMALVESMRPEHLCLGTLKNGTLTWNYPTAESAAEAEAGGEGKEDKEAEAGPPAPPPLRYIGVFTGKGGVGKTTVAAHLAGAFALMGYDVTLLDLDPDQNLRKLFQRDPRDPDGDASLYVPPRRHGLEGATITVLPHHQWHEDENRAARLVICDCSPVLHENPEELIRRFDYVIVPTTLNPLGISKHSDVIVRTFQHLRGLNEKAEMFVILNNYYSDKKRNTVLFQLLKRDLAPVLHRDRKCHLVAPRAVRIRYSVSLFYWGYHIVEGTLPELAFNEYGGRSHPREDFLALAEYLENHTDIEQALKEEEEAPDEGGAA